MTQVSCMMPIPVDTYLNRHIWSNVKPYLEQRMREELASYGPVEGVAFESPVYEPALIIDGIEVLAEMYIYKVTGKLRD